jgi:hypothetical protein
MDIFTRIQNDVHGRLLATPALGGIGIIKDDEETLESKVEKLLTKLGGDGTHLGLCVVVMKPAAVDAEPNLPGPVFDLKQEIQVIEHPTINTGTKGTKIRCGDAALRVLSSLHLFTVGPKTIHTGKNPVVPIPTRDGYVSYMVTVLLSHGSDVVPKVTGIDAATDGDAVTLTCSTPEAAIHFTTDGSFPRPGGETSTLYAAPLLGLPAGTHVRAASYLSNHNPSDVLEFKILDA